MDERTRSVPPHELYARLGTEHAPVLIDVRRPEAFESDVAMLIGAFHRPYDQVPQWLRDLPRGRPIVAYCSHGREVSQGVAKALCEADLHASYLEGGMSAWKEARLPTRRKYKATVDDKWVTREHPKIDRIACPWLISRFINPLAEFIYVPASEVLATAKRTGAIPYDIKDVEFGHRGDRCSFDAIVN